MSPSNDSQNFALAQAQATILATTTAEVARLNKEATDQYVNNTFSEWAKNVTAGRISNANPPQPPPAYTIGYLTDPATSGPAKGARWAIPVLGTVPVCAMPPVPPDESVPKATPIFTGNDSKMNVPAGDVMPVGSVVQDASGNKWVKMASPTPFGVAYYYEKAVTQ